MRVESFRRALLIALTLLGASSMVFGQKLDCVFSTPDASRFPLITFKVTLNENDSLPRPSLSTSDFSVLEDNKSVAHSLTDCDESGSAAIAICVDNSTSMIGTAGDLFKMYPKFLASFETLVHNIPKGSVYKFIPFTDSISTAFPQAADIWFRGANTSDSAFFIDLIKKLTFFGNTDIDASLGYATNLLRTAQYKQKAIVLVTDDNSRKPDSMRRELMKFGITLYTMQVGKDSSHKNLSLCGNTGGVYMQASDTLSYAPIFERMVRLITGEHCLLSYTSTLDCPWYADHIISVDVKRDTSIHSEELGYRLLHNNLDNTPPNISHTTSSMFRRTIDATEFFPCQRGIKSFHDSASVNWRIISMNRKLPNSTQCVIEVIDSLQPATISFIALDSSDNSQLQEVSYIPLPDRIAPIISVYSENEGRYEAFVTEYAPWDRGIASANISTGASNIILDSVDYVSRTYVLLFFRLAQPDQSAYGCIEVHDSAGNTATYCLRRTYLPNDTLAPLSSVDPIQQPRIAINGSISEDRIDDSGIKHITVTPLSNFRTSSLLSSSSKRADFVFALLDSMQPAQSIITATDSADNASLDTVRYYPHRDTVAPKYTVSNITNEKRSVEFTEKTAWDKGLKRVEVFGTPLNMLVTPALYASIREAEIGVERLYKSFPAQATLLALDSADNIEYVTISIPEISIPTKQLITSAMAVFGDVIVGTEARITITITNPNDVPIVIREVQNVGESPSAFTVEIRTPIALLPYETSEVIVRFAPRDLIAYESTFNLYNGNTRIGSIKATGRGIGKLSISADTVHTDYAGNKDTLRISFSAQPVSVNLDTIMFLLDYDSDILHLGISAPDCSVSNPLCSYSFGFRRINDYTLAVELTRKRGEDQLSLTAGTAHLDLPFSTFLSQRSEGVIRVRDIRLSQGVVSEGFDGLVTIGDTCGDRMLRSFLNNQLSVEIHSISPNPVHNDVTYITIHSLEDRQVYASINDLLGSEYGKLRLDLKSGTHAYLFQLSALPSGVYTVHLTSDNRVLTQAMKLTIVR